jgi:sec-independent protein translocase protein TatC
MSAIDPKTLTEKKPRRNWNGYLGAFGRAHQKASAQLETSIPLLQHLDELRRRLFKAFGALMATTAVSFIFAQQIIDYLAAPVGGTEKLVSIEITENIATFMKVSLLGGFILGMPFIIYQIMAFILPGF